MSNYCKNCYELQEQLDQLKAENEKMSKGYSELTEIVSPYIDDFTGYNEKLGGFDIVLCIKELLQQFKHLQIENEELKKWKENVANLFDKTCRCKYLNEENAHCSFYNKECIAINQCLYKNQQTLTEIKEIAEDFYLDGEHVKDKYLAQEILQKISECEVENE